ncbi:MAG: TIGR02206 family membrane protein [Chitinivibrionales bacterium]|nr:TIGR02206 family membrane protein [Chitinivibrionales bacterium]MBD3396669.1 TIGR02206 family membrane protein [Chitinivibrionales bacterium]
MFDPAFPGRFELFTPSHVATMACIAALWIAIPLAFRRWASSRADRIFCHSLAWLLVAQYLGWMLWEAFTGRFSLQHSLPVNLCDISNFLCAVLLITKSYRLFEVVYFWALAGTIQSYITPNIHYSFPHFEFFAFYIQHGGEILSVLYLTIVSGMRPRPVSMLKALFWLAVLIAVTYIINLGTGGNYMFLMADTPHPSTVTRMIHIFGEPPLHMIGLGIVAVFSVLVLYAPFAIKDAAGRTAGHSVRKDHFH